MRKDGVLDYYFSSDGGGKWSSNGCVSKVVNFGVPWWPSRLKTTVAQVPAVAQV